MKALIGFTEHAYGRLGAAVEGVTEGELRWRPVLEMNTAGKFSATRRGSASSSYLGSLREQRRVVGAMTTRRGSAELIYHAGQIALLRGAYGRAKQA